VTAGGWFSLCCWHWLGLPATPVPQVQSVSLQQPTVLKGTLFDAGLQKYATFGVKVQHLYNYYKCVRVIGKLYCAYTDVNTHFITDWYLKNWFCWYFDFSHASFGLYLPELCTFLCSVLPVVGLWVVGGQSWSVLCSPCVVSVLLFPSSKWPLLYWQAPFHCLKWSDFTNAPIVPT